MREDNFQALKNVVVVALLSLVLVSCKPSMDRTAARSFSDSFVSDLDQNRLEDALNKADPEFIKFFGRDKLMEGLKQARDVCDVPLTNVFQFDEIGVHVFLDGRQKPIRTFFYGIEAANGDCQVSVTVFPGSEGGYTVGSLNAHRHVAH